MVLEAFSLSEKTGSLFLSEWMANVAIAVADGESQSPSQVTWFRAHKFVLALASPVFERMLHYQLPDDNKIVIRIMDIDADAFKIVLKFIYKKPITFRSIQDCSNVLHISEKLTLSIDLYKTCNNYLVNNLNTNNFYPIHEIIKRFSLKDKPGGRSLFIKHRQVLSINAEKLLNEPAFRQLKPEDIDDILSADSLVVSSELTIFRALVKWGEEKCATKNVPLTKENLKQEIYKFLRLVRFRNLNLEEYRLEILTTGLINKKEEMYILKQMKSDENGEKHKHRSLNHFYQSISFISEPEQLHSQYGTIAVACSRDLVLTELGFISESDSNSSGVLEIVISNVEDEMLWRVKVNLLDIMKGGMKRFAVPVDNLQLKARTEYKIRTLIFGERLRIAGITDKIFKSCVNGMGLEFMCQSNTKYVQLDNQHQLGLVHSIKFFV